MATLNINGKRVKVDDSFLSLSPEEQNATVDEIAQSLGVVQAAPQLSQEQINARVATAHSAPMQEVKPEYKRGFFNAITDASQSGLMLGVDDEIMAGMLSPIEAGISYLKGDGFDVGQQYNRLQKKFDAQKQARREAHPVASLTGEVLGGLVTAGGAAKQGLTLAGRATTMPGRIAAGAGEGAAYGALVGAGEAEQGNRLEGAAYGGAVGAITGGLMESAVTGLVRRKVVKESVPQTSDLKAAAQSLYKQAEDANVVMRQPVFSRMVDSMKNAAGRVNERLHPKSAGVLEVLQNEAGKSPKLQDIDDLRRILSGAAQKADPDDRRILSIMLNKMDAFIDNAPVNSLSGRGDGVKMWREAQAIWKKKAKSEIVEDIVEKARNQATGFENGMRVQFRQLANNPKRFRNFNKQEQAAIKRIVRGGPMENILRSIGWLSPTGIFGALTVGGVGAGTGVLPGAALAVAGFGARKGAEALTRGNVHALERAIKIGDPKLRLSGPTSSPLQGAGAITTQEYLPLPIK